MVTRKAYAKLNIALIVVGEENGYHNLDSVCLTVDKFDVITAKKRKDDKILVTFTGKYGFTPKLQEETLAYKAIKLFLDRFSLPGVNVTVERNVPDGSGMGGSSLDIAGTLVALKKLFKVNCDLKPIADELGSDSRYLLNGGFARLNGRGTEVSYFDCDREYYFVAIYAKNGTTAKDCFAKYDEMELKPSEIDCEKVISALQNGNLEDIRRYGGNDLTKPAIALNIEIAKNLSALKELCPEVCFMTGSGSTCYAMYDSYEMASWATDKLKSKYKGRVELLYTYNPQKLTAIEKFFGVKKEIF